MEEDLISIVVPVYNVEDYLKECLESIIKQTYRNLEIILVDDGSTDNSGRICEEYKEKDSRILVIHKKNGGLSSARNEGIKHAKGNLIQFVDSDDYLELDMIELLYNMLKNNNADISICSFYILKNKNVYTDANYSKCLYNKVEGIKELLIDQTIRNHVFTKLFKKVLFENVLFPEGRRFEDILTMPKLFSKAERIAFEDIPKYYYRQRDGSIVHKQTVELNIEYVNAVLEAENYVKELDLKLEKNINYNFATLTVNVFNNAGIFDLPAIADQPIVQELYKKLKEMSLDKEMEKFFMEKMSNARKIHYYYLIEDKDNYVKNNKCLPMLYPEQEIKK